MSRQIEPATLQRPLNTQRADRAANLASALLVAMPLVMWAANRSAPLVLALAALCLVLADVLNGHLRLRLVQLRARLARPLGWATLGFLGWSLVTLAWSHRPANGIAMYGELVVSLGAGFIVATCWPAVSPAWARRGLGWSLALAGLLIFVELRTGPGFRDALGLRSQLFVYNRPILTDVLLIAPAIHGLWSAPKALSRDRALALLATVSVVAATMAGESGAAKLGLMLMAATWLLALVLPRLALAGAAAAFLGMMVIAPVLGPLADRLLPASVYQQLARAHARDRVDIWLSFDEAIRARPLIGSGFGTSAALRSHPVAEQVAPEHRLLLDVGHPHNAFLQVWVETGLVGVLFVSAAGLAFLTRLRHMEARRLAPRLAVLAAALGVVSVGHGAWQGWWVAALAATAVWFMGLARQGVGKGVGKRAGVTR